MGAHRAARAPGSEQVCPQCALESRLAETACRRPGRFSRASYMECHVARQRGRWEGAPLGRLVAAAGHPSSA